MNYSHWIWDKWSLFQGQRLKGKGLANLQLSIKIILLLGIKIKLCKFGKPYDYFY